MKRVAFTMLELVFVIVVIGIMSALMIPRVDNKDTLLEAAIQVASHIRYAQHLAMVEDKYIPSVSFSDESAANVACQTENLTRQQCQAKYWYLGRWTIRFYQNLTFASRCPVENFNNIWSYTVFSDRVAYTGNPDLNEMARNPKNANEFLSGGFNNILCVDNRNNAPTQQSMPEMRLGTKYNIRDIAFAGGCRANIRYLSFDHLGRPFNSFPNNQTPYQVDIPNTGWPRLLTAQCRITLCSVNNCATAAGDQQVTIAIEPETGYTHIL